MNLARCWSHENAESVLFEKGLGEVYAEALETIRRLRIELTPCRVANEPRAIRERILGQLAEHGWEMNTRIFPMSAPASFQRGQYRLDASKRVRAGAALGIILHFGSAEFTVRKLMLVTAAVRRGIVDCGVVALMTHDVRSYFAGRPACYDQALRLLQAYGQSEFFGIPMILLELVPTAVPLEFANSAGVGAGVR